MRTSARTSAEATIRLRYEPTTARLHVDVAASGTGQDAPLAAALHRSHDSGPGAGTGFGPGPILAPVLLRGQRQGSADVVLDALARADLQAGRLYVVLYTPAAPLGAGQAKLVFTPVSAE